MKKTTRILYVDDYPLDRELVRDALEKEHGGFELVEAATRAEFETVFAKGGFDLVLSDFNILGFEGLQVLEAVQAKFPNVPVIIVTGTGSEEVAAEAIKRGAADYVIKTPKHILRLPHTIHVALEKKRLEIERRMADEAAWKWANVFENAGWGILVSSAEGETLEIMNPAFARMLGYNVEDLTCHPIVDVIAPEARAYAAEQFRLADRKGHHVFEMLHIRKDGTVFPAAVDVTTFIDQAGSALYRAVNMQDISERKRAEEELRQSEQKYRELINAMSDTVWVIDFNGNLVDVNNAAMKVLGYSKEELLAIGLFGIDSSLKKEHITALAKAMPSDNVQIFETSHKAKNGRIIPVEISSSLVTFMGKQAILSIARDITERKQAEEELLKKMAELQQFHNLTVGRELMMIELKKEVNELLKQNGQKEKYRIVE